MTPIDPATQPMEDPEANLERALIKEFLKLRGLDLAALDAMGREEAARVLTEASIYAATRLAEVESRAHYVRDIHRHE